MLDQNVFGAYLNALYSYTQCIRQIPWICTTHTYVHVYNTEVVNT